MSYSLMHIVPSLLNISYDSSSKNNRRSNVEKTKLWDEEKRDIFINNLDGTKLSFEPW